MGKITRTVIRQYDDRIVACDVLRDSCWNHCEIVELKDSDEFVPRNARLGCFRPDDTRSKPQALLNNRRNITRSCANTLLLFRFSLFSSAIFERSN